MLEQQGHVTSAAGGRVAVRLGGRSGCAACDAGRGCGAGVFGRLLRRRPVILEFDNYLGARVGQGVVVGVPEAWFLRLTTRFYAVPLLAGLGGAACGHYVSVMLQTDAILRDVAALAGALALAAVAVAWSRAHAPDLQGAEAVRLLRLAGDPAAAGPAA